MEKGKHAKFVVFERRIWMRAGLPQFTGGLHKIAQVRWDIGPEDVFINKMVKIKKYGYQYNI